ncbi:hypothetical protein L1987_37972 [Smallanthus sonchifolius]|uniref:Uncharacterized protein n=1 Tax=Smallanthus sonchifolius TaxID=185202 RepID=A0ACB9HIK2_9ASTR|nr:hypothetical protein L1987_37972 [Smallanthus sonchifolius]
MASGSSSKGFDFASDDILCSYEDYANQEQSNTTHSDSAKEFNKNRMARSTTTVFPASSYNPADDPANQEVVITAVERSVKKHTDNVMRFLEGLSSRLSQLELYCYNLDKSTGEMRSDLSRDNVDSELKLKFLEKQMQEVHRSVQLLRDKQELADTQKELAKLQLARKESSSSSHNSQQNDDRSSSPDMQKKENVVESHALALVPVPVPAPATQPVAGYYLPPGLAQVSQTQYQQSQLAQYPQQWNPQATMQPGSRPALPQVYPQYLPGKPPVRQSPEPVANSMPMQMTYSAIPPPASNQPVNYSYGGPVRTTLPQLQQQLLPQHLKLGDGYAAGGPPGAYMVYDNASGRVQHPVQGGNYYAPNQQQSGGGGMMSQ